METPKVERLPYREGSCEHKVDRALYVERCPEELKDLVDFVEWEVFDEIDDGEFIGDGCGNCQETITFHYCDNGWDHRLDAWIAQMEWPKGQDMTPEIPDDRSMDIIFCQYHHKRSFPIKDKIQVFRIKNMAPERRDGTPDNPLGESNYVSMYMGPVFNHDDSINPSVEMMPELKEKMAEYYVSHGCFPPKLSDL